MNDHFVRAQHLFEMRKFATAEAELRDALSEEPNKSECYALLALCLLHRRAIEESLDAARQAVALSANDGQPYYVLCIVNDACGRKDLASDAINTAISIDPSNPEYFFVRASLSISDGKYQQSLQDANQGLAIDPQHLGCLNIKAWSTHKLGFRLDAEEAINNALKENPNSSVSHMYKGIMSLETGQVDAAILHLHEGLRADPLNDFAKQGLLEALKAHNSIYSKILQHKAELEAISDGTFEKAYPGKRAPARKEDVGFALAVVRFIVIPISNFFFQFTKSGQLLLSPGEKAYCNMVVPYCTGVLGVGVAALVLRSDLMFGLMLYYVILGLSLPFVFVCRAGTYRTIAMLILLAAIIDQPFMLWSKDPYYRENVSWVTYMIHASMFAPFVALFSVLGMAILSNRR